MKLNYSLNSGFATGDGTAPTRENVAAWVAWVPVRAADLDQNDSQDGTQPGNLGTDLYLTPRAIPGLSEETVLLGALVGELQEAGLVDTQAGPFADTLNSTNPQALSYADPAAGTHVPLQLAQPLPAELVRVVAVGSGPARRHAQNAFAATPGDRQFHIMHEIFEV